MKLAALCDMHKEPLNFIPRGQLRMLVFPWFLVLPLFWTKVGWAANSSQTCERRNEGKFSAMWLTVRAGLLPEI